MKRLHYLFIFLMGTTMHLMGSPRSILRPREVLPEITTFWSYDSPTYTLRDSHLEEGPIFQVFNKEYFYTKMLPRGTIAFRNSPAQSVQGTQLNKLIENLLVELKAKKKKLTDFMLLKGQDFNNREFCGLLVLKFKNYPFVLKLFIENPQSFVNPYNKGLEPGAFFVMGGGIMRHLTGFTRIRNLEDINMLIRSDPYWSQIVDTPRKWHWLPENPRWFHVEGRNLGPSGKVLHTSLPSIYAIIADEIVIDKEKTLLHQRHALRCMRLCQFTDYRIDPHINNFRIERNTGKLVLIDTENFRVLVGLRDHFSVDSYITWYLNLGRKFLTDKFFRDKKTRKQIQLEADDWSRDVASAA